MWSPALQFEPDFLVQAPVLNFSFNLRLPIFQAIDSDNLIEQNVEVRALESPDMSQFTRLSGQTDNLINDYDDVDTLYTTEFWESLDSINLGDFNSDDQNEQLKSGIQQQWKYRDRRKDK